MSTDQMQEERLEVGDYVLATKWRDGDPGDHFCVGFVVAAAGAWPRYDVVNTNGEPFRGNGFRRAEKITVEEGSHVICRINELESGGVCVWDFLASLRRVLRQGER